MTQKQNQAANILINTAIVATVTFLVNLGLFVTFKDMYAYAAPKESVEQLGKQLNRIELKVNELCIKQHIRITEE
jgi:hypothetical protein